MRRRLGLVLLIGLCALGCGREETVEPHVLVVGVVNAPRRLDPRFAVDAVGQRIGQLVYPGLLRRTPSLDLEPDVAVSMQLEDNRTYVFTLRPGLTFSDGRPLRAQDVVFTYRSVMDPKSASPKAGAYAMVEDVRALDERRVSFRLKDPYASFPINCTLGIVPAGTPVTAEDEQPPPGLGPFRIERVEEDQAVHLVRARPRDRGGPPLDRIVFRVIENDSARMLALETGEVQLLQNDIPPGDLRRFQRLSRLRVLEGPGTDVAYMGFNLEDPHLADPRVRRAMAYAIDRQSLIDTLLGGHAVPADSLLTERHWAHAPDLPAYDYDPRRAVELLEAAGLAADDEGIRLRLTFLTSQNPMRQKIAEFLANDFRRVGIALDLRSYDWGKFFDDVQAGRFQLYTLQWVGLSDPDIYHMVFNSSRIPPQGANRGRYRSERMDALTEEARRTLDREARRRLYWEIQRLAQEDVPYVNLWHPNQITVMDARLEGFVQYPTGDMTSLAGVQFRTPKES